jgi:hypothetical protein
MALTPIEMGRLPPSMLAERGRELRQRGVFLCWRAQRLRSKSQRLLAKVRQRRQRWPFASIEDTAASCPSGEDLAQREETCMVQQRRTNPPPLVREAQSNDLYLLAHGEPHDPCPVAACQGTLLFLHR